MKKCVYCLKQEGETTFNNEEHIIPQSLGGKTFPTISKNLVCDSCNSILLSNLETKFKRDSIEGLYAQMFNIWSKSVWITGENIEIETVEGFGERFFDEAFPFLSFQNNTPVVNYTPQLKVRNKKSGYQVFPLKTLQKAEQSRSKDFREIKERLSKVSNKDMLLFSNSNEPSDFDFNNSLSLLKKYGMDYKETKRIFSSIKETKQNIFKIKWRYKLNPDGMRVIAKIAFNYFIYCSQEEGEIYTEKLFSNNFNEIRNYIVNGYGNWNDIVEISELDYISDIEKDNPNRIIAHTIKFFLREDRIIAYISLFGEKIYKVNIGKSPFSFIPIGLGCGHIFDPFTNTVYPIGPSKYSINRLTQPGYGLFKL